MYRAQFVLVGLLIGVTGCLHEQTTRSQSDDLDRDDPPVQTIGDVTAFSNTEPIPVSGVGLVYNLQGTGHSPAGEYRNMIENELKREGVANVEALLDSPNQAVVLVSALIPPGARKGDPLDVQVSLPPGSQTTSLRGGILWECSLVNFNSARNMSARYAATQRGDRLLLGDALVKAAGPLTLTVPPEGEHREGEHRVGEEEADLATQPELPARIWQGGRCLRDRPLYLVLNLEHQRAPFAAHIASQINKTFDSSLMGSDSLAEAKTKEVIYLSVPAQYRLNLPRFMRVVRMIPLNPISDNDPYRYQLEEDMLNPAKTISAALRLEALGRKSIPTLRPGLQSAYPLVRFACAEALAYLGDSRCGNELGQLAAEYPPLQAYCLTALGSLNEAVSFLKLRELLDVQEPGVRYGAFRALAEIDPRDPLIRGLNMNGSYRLHQVGSASSGLVHVSTNGRAEIVLFGQKPMVQAPFSYLVGPEFTVTAGSTDDVCTISRFSVQKGTDRRQCSFEVAEILRTLTEMGGTYSDAVEFIQQAHESGILTCPLVLDAQPQALEVTKLAELGASNPTLTGVRVE